MHPLDNPIWGSLVDRHRSWAIARGEVLRYPVDVAPFVAFAGLESTGSSAFTDLVDMKETVYLLGPKLTEMSGWKLESCGPLIQMVCEQPVAEIEGPTIHKLAEEHRQAVLQLTALVYPHYFRTRTMDLGRYFGIFEAGQLVAMIGERMGMKGFQEISAVCTHPQFTGRGLARHLLTYLANDIMTKGEIPFLHVSPQNQRAYKLYEQVGFRMRHQPMLWSLSKRAGV